MQRRLFLSKSIISSFGYWALGFGSKGPSEIYKTDTHVHLFDLTRFQYPWLKEGSFIHRDFRWHDYISATKDCHIGKVLFMESGVAPEFALEEARTISQLAEKESRIRGIIAQLDLSGPLQDSDTFKQLKDIRLLRGARGKFLPKSPNFIENLALLSEYGLTFDLLLSIDQLEDAAGVCQKSLQTTFILDHLGNPNNKPEDILKWKRGIDKLAELPNVHCKVSGMITRFGKTWTMDDLVPFFLQVYQSFGPERLLYGGDWPVVLLSGSYQSWSEVFDELTSNLPTTEREMICFKNADRIYNI